MASDIYHAWDTVNIQSVLAIVIAIIVIHKVYCSGYWLGYPLQKQFICLHLDCVMQRSQLMFQHCASCSGKP